MTVPQRLPQTGFVLVYILVLSAVLVSLVSTLFALDVSVSRRIITRTAALQAEQLADAGLEQALVRLRANASFSGETFSLGNGTVTTTITADGLNRTLTAMAIIAGLITNPVIRTRRLVVQGDPAAGGAAFAFAVQTDTGGFATGQNRNPQIDGNLYSNGDVQILGPGAKVTGNVTAVGEVINNGQIDGTITQGALPQSMPQIDVAGWQAKALEGQTHTGDYAVQTNGTIQLGAPANIGVITGRLLVPTNATIILTGPVWVQGLGGSSLEISGNPRFLLADEATQSVILANGRLTFSGNARFETEDDDSDLLVMTTAPGSYSPSTDAVVINANPKFTNTALYAPNGQINIGQSASGLSITSFTAAKIFVDSNAKIDYSEGLIDATFNPAGPTGGSFSVVSGSYQNLAE